MPAASSMATRPTSRARFPVSGQFSAPQRDVYELVLAAQAAAMATVAPGAAWNAPHDAAVRVLAQGFIDLGLCQGSVDQVIENGDYQQILYASHRPLAGSRRARRGRIQDRRRTGASSSPAWCSRSSPAAIYDPATACPSISANIGVRIEDDVARHGGRQRSVDRGRAEDGRRDRSADAWLSVTRS